MIWVIPLITVCLLVGVQADDCPKCDHKDEHICGRNQVTGQIKTFKSECHMQADNCAGLEEHKFFAKGACLPEVPECLAFCTGIYKPICTVSDFGGDWGTWESECLLNKRNCVTFPGSRKIADGPCPINCPPCKNNQELHISVCGKYENGTIAIFSNNCALLLENCKQPNAKIKQISFVECQPARSLLTPPAPVPSNI